MASFLRRVDRPGKIKEGIIRPTAFQCRAGETELSFTLWKSGDVEAFQLEEYQKDNPLPSGDLPGLIEVTAEQFEQLGLSVPAKADDEQDPKYGHLHYVTSCLDEVSADRLAKALSPSGIRLGFVRH